MVTGVLSPPKAPLQTSYKWIVQRGSFLKVTGSTNVNKFTCDVANYNNPDTLTLFKTGNITKIKGGLAIRIKGFNCHHKVMSEDLYKTLKSDKFPNMHIQFVSLDYLPTLTKRENIPGKVNIRLAGTAKQFPVTFSVYRDQNHQIHLIGKKQVRFDDFKLDPPTKLGGMIKTNQELDVEFHLLMKGID